MNEDFRSYFSDVQYYIFKKEAADCLNVVIVNFQSQVSWNAPIFTSLKKSSKKSSL